MFPHEVKNLLDIKLEKEGTARDEFKKTLKEIVLNSPKSSSKLFLINFLAVDTAKLY